MEIRLLGPFEVVTEGAPRRVGGRGEQALLALLALSPGKVLTASTLIDALWQAADLPDDPGNALQLRISKLRRALAAAGAADLVRRDGSGYRLQVEPRCVDAHRFGQLVDEARRTGEAAPAVGAYDQALQLWRGEPLVDFATDGWAVVESARLTELRLAAVVERADRQLSLGRFEQVVEELEPLVAQTPTRERLVAQLMTAMFNAGRQAEALEVYGRTKRLLADELGIDPSRELRFVMEQILRQDLTIVPAQETAPARVAVLGPTPAALPLRSTSFVGRETDLQRVATLMTSARLVTLAGPGGAGKTALAIEAARAGAERFRDGAVLVRLAAVTEREMLVHALADALAVTIEGGTAAHRPRDLLLAHLRTRNTLLVLDNCEHLIEPIAMLAAAILDSCPDVQIIATSREALAVPGEVQLPVAPLAVPDADARTEDVADIASVRLFLDRALAATPGLTVDEETLAAVAVICRRLDGIPLALELAAARLVSLSPGELAERVRDRFSVLNLGTRTAEARQQTLRATVDWSHDLLAPAERLLFRRLAVFRGGWTFDAAEQVVTGTGVEPGHLLDLLDRLVRQSLVAADRVDGRTRYRMLETLRQYASDRLAAAEELPVVQAAHATYYLRLAEQAETGLRGPDQSRWRSTLITEHANIRAAMSWFIGTEGQVEGALRMAGSLGLFWHKSRHLEGRETLRRVLALPGGSPHARARAMQAVSLVERPRACIVHPSEQCAAAALQSLEIFESVGDGPRAAFSRLLLAVEGVGAAPRSDAADMLARARADFAEQGDAWGLAVSAFVLMETLNKLGDEAAADEAAAEAVARFRALGDGWGLSAVLYHRAWGLARFGHHADAVPVYQEAIAAASEAGVHNTVQWATADLGLTLLAVGRVAEAAACFDRVGESSAEDGDETGRVLAQYGAAVVAMERGDHLTARPLFDTASTAFERLGVPLAMGLALAGTASCDEELGDVSGATAEYARLVSLGEGAGEVGLIAAGLEGLARTALASGNPRAAAVMLGRAQLLRAVYDRPATTAEQARTDQGEAAARAALGEDAFAEAARQGAVVGLGSTSSVP